MPMTTIRLQPLVKAEGFATRLLFVDMKKGHDMLTVVNRPFHSEPLRRHDEFYKKGCQEKSSPSTGGREDFVSRSSPLHCKSASSTSREVLLLSCLPFP